MTIVSDVWTLTVKGSGNGIRIGFLGDERAIGERGPDLIRCSFCNEERTVIIGGPAAGKEVPRKGRKTISTGLRYFCKAQR